MNSIYPNEVIPILSTPIKTNQIPCMSHICLLLKIPFHFSYIHVPQTDSITIIHCLQTKYYLLLCLIPYLFLMALELQRPRVTEIQVRMDCNGCVQRIKKTLNNIDGINDIYFDLPQQKITIIGWADPEYIIKAIRRTKRNATICSPNNTEPTQSPSQPPEQAPDNAKQKQEDDGPPEKSQAKPRKEPPPPPAPEQPPPEEATALPKLKEDSSSQPSQSPPESEDEGEVHEIYQHPPYYGSRDASCHECVGHREVFLQEPPTQIYVTHSYNTYQPPPYVTEFEYVRSYQHMQFSRMEHYSGEYYNESASFTSMFSDENPNSCTIV